MNENENKDKKDMEKNNNTMEEKVHYEIKFVETEDGYRLEASGDKEALKRLGIGPNMVGRKRKGSHRRRRGHGRARQARRMGPRQRRRAAMMARRRHGMHHAGCLAYDPWMECDDFASGPLRRPDGPRRRKDARGRRDAPEHGRPGDKDTPGFTGDTVNW